MQALVWARSHDKLAETIAGAAQEAVRKYLGPDGRACYWCVCVCVPVLYQSQPPPTPTHPSRLRVYISNRALANCLIQHDCA